MQIINATTTKLLRNALRFVYRQDHRQSKTGGLSYNMSYFVLLVYAN